MGSRDGPLHTGLTLLVGRNRPERQERYLVDAKPVDKCKSDKETDKVTHF
jgi:hypothetical protein